MLEADVRELPEHVVAAHDPPVVPGELVVTHPHEVIRLAIRGPRTPTHPDGEQPPHSGSAKRVGDRGAGVGDDEECIAGASAHPERADRVALVQRHRREGPGSDDDGVDELHGDVLRVVRRAGRPAPQGARVGEPARERECGNRERGGGVPGGLGPASFRHVAPHAPLSPGQARMVRRAAVASIGAVGTYRRTAVISALVEGAQTQYAKSGDRYIGYQVLGDGPIDLLALNNGSNIWIDRDEEPHWARFDRRLASFTRLIRFDPSGVGLSDPLAGGELPTVELWTHDAVAVLDAVESEHAALLGVSTGGAVAMLLSAMYPERISALVLMNCSARLARDDDYPCGIPQHVLDRFVNSVSDPTRGDDRVDDLELLAPSLAG